MSEIANNGMSVATAPAREARMIGGPPPHPLDAEWYMLSKGEQYGPFTGHRMKELMRDGRLAHDTDVVRTDSQHWISAGADSVLGALFSAQPMGTAAAQPSPATAHVTAEHGATIVQVTNNLAPSQPQVIVLDGEAKSKSAGLALFLSFLFVGLGQFYNGHFGKGIFMFIITIALWFVLLGWVTWIWSMADAYSNAKKMNERYQRRLAAGMIL